MNLRSLSISLVLALLAAFAVLNWAAFTTPTQLSLGFTEVQAPLGLIVLVATGVVSGLFLVYIVSHQAGVILEARRYAKELKTQRDLADNAEASRFTELKSFIEEELRKLRAQGAAGSSELGERIERLQRELQDKVAESTLTLSAYVGEVDDKLDRALPPVGAAAPERPAS